MKFLATLLTLIFSIVASGMDILSTEKSFAPEAPSIQASNLKFSAIRPNQVTLNWTNGDGTRRIVLLKEGNSGPADPVDNTTYAVSSSTPCGWTCVYNGTANTALISGLISGKDYTIHICEYNGIPGEEKYLANSLPRNPVSFNTLFSEPPGAPVYIQGLNEGNRATFGDYYNVNNDEPYIDIITDAGTYLNTKNLTFSSQSAFPTNQGSDVICRDFDNDGYIDVLLAPLLFHNNGDNTFSQIECMNVANIKSALSSAAGDYDNDGDIDFLFSANSVSEGLFNKIYRNDGNNTFTEMSDIKMYVTSEGTSSWLDFDNDNDLDILLTGNYSLLGPSSFVYRNNGDGSFTEIVNSSLPGVSKSSAAAGDYDSDGYLDILLTGESLSGKISRIYKGNGNGTFTEQSSINLPGVSAGSAAWGDVDNDGKLDFVITGMSDSGAISSIYRNNGDNTFTELKTLLLTPLYKGSAVFGDLDNDTRNDLDLFLYGSDGSGTYYSRIFRNNSSQTNSIPSPPTNLGFVIKGNNALLTWERVTSDETNQKSISYNIRIGKSSGASDVVPSHSFASGYRKIADQGNCQLNNSYYIRNLRWNTNYYASVQSVDNSYKGGPFSNEVIINVSPVQATGLYATHLSNNTLLLKWKRGNGNKCIVFANENKSDHITLVNNKTYYANQVYGEGSPADSYWYCIYKGEADSVLLSGLSPSKNYIVEVLEYQGGRGDEVYLTTGNTDNIGLFSTSVFSPQSQLTFPPVSNGSVRWADINNDGYLDALFTGMGITRIYSNNGNNTFTEQNVNMFPGLFCSSLSPGDYDNDNDLDLLITGSTDGIQKIAKIFRNDGDFIFTEQSSIPLPGVALGTATWGDYDNDDDLDILLNGVTGNYSLAIDSLNTGSELAKNCISKVYRNDNGSFTDTGVNLQGIYNGFDLWGDYNNDGDLDILFSGYPSRAGLYLNTGNAFTLQSEIKLLPAGYGETSWGDFNNDGYNDILSVGTMDSVFGGHYSSDIYANSGKGSFSKMNNAGLVLTSAGVAQWIDYDNDGLQDVFISGYYNLVSGVAKMYRNTGESFVEQKDISITPLFLSSSSWGDYDNDGDMDLLLSGINSFDLKLCMIFRNNTIMRSGAFSPNTKPDAPAGMVSSFNPEYVKLSWTPVRTDITPVRTMSYNVRFRKKDEQHWHNYPQSADDGYRKTPSIGNTQLNNFILLKNLPAGVYEWQVQGIDQTYAGGAWSQTASFEVRSVQTYFSSDEVCLGYATHFTDQSVATSGVSSWKWDLGDGTISTLQNATHTYDQSGTYNVKLVITDTEGKKDSLVQAVIVKPKPLTGFDAPPVCLGNPLTVTNTTDLNGLVISGWSWNFGDASTSSVQQPSPHPYLSAADYTVSLKAVASNGCADSVTKTVTVATYPVAVITTSGPVSFCQGDNVMLTAPYNAAYLYSWKLLGNKLTDGSGNTFKAISEGQYTVEITNPKANCISISPPVNVVTRQAPIKPVIQSSNYVAGKCPGSNPVRLTTESVNGYRYQWKVNGIEHQADSLSYIEFFEAGNYSLTAYLNGCTTQSDVFTADFPSGPIKPVIYAEGPTYWYLACSNTEANAYKWYWNGKLIENATKYFFTANQKLGVYQVSVGDKNGCFTKSDPVTIPPGYTGLEETDPFSALKIYPNPTTGLFTVEMDNNIMGELSIDIFTQAGNKILNIKFEKTTQHFKSQVDLSGQSKGMYVINFLLKKYFTTRKVMVE